MFPCIEEYSRGYSSTQEKSANTIFPRRNGCSEGDSVNYLNWEDLRRALDWDIEQEKNFQYKGLSDDEKIEHIAKFVSGIRQIHAFREGNTRTTAIFTIQYLRSLGYKVNNEMFAKHSLVFPQCP